MTGSQTGRRTAIFLGGRQAGCIGLLALLAAGWRVAAAVAYDDDVRGLATALGVPVAGSVAAPEIAAALAAASLLVSVHGRQIVRDEILSALPLGGINVHPCLYAYKGARPVERLLADRSPRASVGVHRMTDRVDEGEVLVERFVDVSGITSVDGVYNALYPTYASALVEALGVVRATRLQPSG